MFGLTAPNIASGADKSVADFAQDAAQAAQDSAQAAQDAKNSVSEMVTPIEDRLSALEAMVEKQAEQLADLGGARVLAMAELDGKTVIYKSSGIEVSFDGNDAILTFPNPKGLSFVTLLTDVALPQGYTTQTHILSGKGPTYVRVRSKALDTGDRQFPPQHFTVAVLGMSQQ